MPYPESCPECGGAFRNTGTHYTARRNEVGRHVLLELGCQNTARRYWWNFTTGVSADDNATSARRPSFAPSDHVVEVELAAAAPHGSFDLEPNGHTSVVTLEPPAPPTTNGHHVVDEEPVTITSDLDLGPGQPPDADLPVTPGPAPVVPPTLKEAFLRQLQLDRLTLRQMRTWLMADDARRAMEVAAGATEATYERLALILFGVDLPQLLGRQAAPPPTPGMSAEERLELQREKARIRARLRRAAAKAARQP
jgi:hypothetical protein